MHFAAARKPDIVKLLGRDLTVEAVDRETGWTDLHYAAVADLPEAIAELVRDGIPVDQRLGEESAPFGDWLQNVLSGLGHEEAFEGWKADGETALMLAVYIDALGAAAALVDRGADIHAKDDKFRTPLHYAVQINAVDAARFLAGRGAEISARNNDGKTPLDIAQNTEIQSILRSQDR